MQVEVKQPSPEVPPEITRRELKPCLTVDTVRSDSFGSHDSKNASLQRNDLAVIGEMGTPASRQEPPRRTGNTAKREDVPDGNPPIDVGEDMERIQVLMKDEEHLTAFSLYQEIVEYVEGLEQGVEKESCLRTLEAHQEDITTLKALTSLFEEAKQRLLVNDSWIECHNNDGIRSSFRIEADKTLSLKIEGELTGVPLFEQVSVLREIDFYNTWSPCCKKSRKLHNLGRLDTVGWMELSVLGFVRDSIFRCVGCNAIDEEGKIILVAKGLDYENDDKSDALQDEKSNANEAYDEVSLDFLVQDSRARGIPIPPKPKGFGAGRLGLNKFEGIIDVISPTSARVFLVSNLDTTVIISKPIISFVMKHMCAIVLSRLQSAALKATKEPLRNPHAQKMRKDPFYMDWLRPKFEKYSEKMGWTLPDVNALEIDDGTSALNSSRSGTGTYSSGTRTHAFTKEQIDRLRELQDYKPPPRSTKSANIPTRVVTARPRRSSAALLTLMLFVFYGEISMSSTPSLPEQPGNEYMAHLMQIAKTASNLSLYICLHWSVMATLLVSFFERIESATIFQYMPTVKDDFVERAHNPIFCLSCSMIALAFVKAMFNLILSKLALRDQLSFQMEVMNDTRCMMTYSAVFLWLCTLFLSTIFPKQEGSFRKNGVISCRGVDGGIHSDEDGSRRSNHEAITYNNDEVFDPDLSSLDDTTLDIQLTRKGFRSRFMKRI